MALKPVTPKSHGRSPLQRPAVSPFAPAYTKKTKSNSGLWIFLLLVVAGGAFCYVYTHRQQAPVAAKPKVIISGNPEWANGNADSGSEAAENGSRPKKTALGTVGSAE